MVLYSISTGTLTDVGAALCCASVRIATSNRRLTLTIVDSAGVQKMLVPADGAHARGVLSSTNKAVTALTFKASTSHVAESIKTDQVLAGKIAAPISPRGLVACRSTSAMRSSARSASGCARQRER